MKELLKEIRVYIGMSQQELASQLGLTFQTINRWENGKAFPNKLAQIKLYEFCKENSIPVFDMTMHRIKGISEKLAIEDDRVLLYHGSKSGIVGDIAPISREKCDFGQGFYMGTDPLQPLSLISGFEKARFYIVSLSMKELSTLQLEPNLEWAMVVAYNRGRMEKVKGSELYEKYRNLCANRDMMIGYIADDRIFFVLDSFFQGVITDIGLVNSLSALKLGKQYVTLTQKGCSKVRIEKEIPISHLEQSFLRDISVENRAKGISMANDICKNYRREGLFFDEILESQGGK